MNPSPFEIAQQTSNNFAQVGQRRQDTNAIEGILAQAMSANDPAVLQNSIGKILSQVSPERQGPAVQYLQSVMSNLKEQQQKDLQKQAAQQAGYTYGAPEAVQVQQLKNMQPRSAPGGLTGQAVPPEVAQKIQEVINSNPDANPDQLALEFDKVGIPPAYTNKYIQNRRDEKDLIDKRLDRRSALGDRLAEKVFSQADEVAASIPQKETALNLMEQSIANNNLSFISGDTLADLTGIEGFRSKEGAIFKTAAKEYFLGNLSRAGGRPNQWIEQQIIAMLPQIGRTEEANLSVISTLRNELNIDKERVRLTQEVADELENSGGDYRKLSSIVQQRLSKYAKEKEKELFNDLRAIKSISEKTYQKLENVKEGTKASKYVIKSLLRQNNNDAKKAAEDARKLGYIVE